MAGYQGKIPELSVQRDRVPGTYDPTRRPGSSGQRYFTDTQYVPASQGSPLQTDPAGLAALNATNPAKQVRGYASGGITSIKEGQYLDGPSDGMADDVPANIDGAQEAALSDGEFVIPADVVSGLGNGNSDAGAEVLSAMMDRVRKARTGKKAQPKEISAAEFLPV
jgi:hypothetical protein